MGSFESPAMKHDLIVGLEIFDRKLENVFVQSAYLAGQVIAKPEQIDDVDFIAALEQPGNQNRSQYPAPPATSIFMCLLRD